MAMVHMFRVPSNGSSQNHDSALPAITLNIPYTVAEVVIAVLSSIGNALVCVAILQDKQLWTVTNCFVVSLATADVCVGALAIPCAIMSDIGLPRHNLNLCLLMLSVIIMLTQSSIFCLLAVAVERYIAIFFPLRYSCIMTHQKAVTVIILTWVLAFILGLVPMMGWHKPVDDTSHCFFAQVVDMTYMVYFNFFGCVFVPLAIMFVIYAQIFIVVKKQRQRLLGNRRQYTNMKKEVKTATSLFLVVFLFTICWIPLHIINCLILLCPACQIPLPLLQTAIILSHANSAINPVLYAYKMKSFRNALKINFLHRNNTVQPEVPNRPSCIYSK